MSNKLYHQTARRYLINTLTDATQLVDVTRIQRMREAGITDEKIAHFLDLGDRTSISHIMSRFAKKQNPTKYVTRLDLEGNNA